MGYKVRRKRFFCCFKKIFSDMETEGIVRRDRRRVVGKVEKIRTCGEKEKMQ